MILYRNTKGGFEQDVRSNLIAEKIENAFFEHCISHNNGAEYRSWANSMQYMCNVLADPDISDDCRVAIEYQIPLACKRIDFLIAGSDDQCKDNVVVVELKQWESSEPTSRPDIVTAFTGGANRAVAHPSYQAYSYAKIIESYNQSLLDSGVSIIPCAYLHNYKEAFRRNIDETYYRDAVEAAPIFLGRDALKLRKFIKQFVKQRSGKDLLMMIENGKLKPSKSLQDTLASMLKGNREFYLIDEQKVAYETVRKLVSNVLRREKKDGIAEKKTLIVRGGPGTGKSVIAVQLLCDLISQGHSAFYVTKNAAPRNVYFEKLRQDKFRLNYIKSLFKSSGTFYDAPFNSVDCILADEAHRLQMKSGMFQNHGEAQVKEIIHTARVSVFFIDEEQKVTTTDACSVEMIRHYAAIEGSTVIEGPDYDLCSQFRCNGSDGYLSFLSSLLGLSQMPNVALGMEYDFKVFTDPGEMREAIRTKNLINNKSRLLAGYCYNWESKNDMRTYDIQLKNGFRAQWNFSNTSTWAIDPTSFDQVGCIHTSQGLEFDYVGVIIGRDLIYRNGRILTDPTQRARTDKSLQGYMQKGGLPLADAIIRNTYKTLMTRGQKGCYIYCEDEALGQYIQSLLQSQPTTIVDTEEEEDEFILQEVPEEEKFTTFFPLYSIRAACGRFGSLEPVEMMGWVKANGNLHKDRTKFVVQAVGHSMEPRIQDGDYCLFKTYAGGSREGKIVLAENIGEVDEDYSGSFTIKEYHSQKKYNEDGEWEHESITLKSLNHSYPNIELNAEEADEFRIIGEFVEKIEE